MEVSEAVARARQYHPVIDTPEYHVNVAQRIDRAFKEDGSCDKDKLVDVMGRIRYLLTISDFEYLSRESGRAR
jgi:hypothetical protein